MTQVFADKTVSLQWPHRPLGSLVARVRRWVEWAGHEGRGGWRYVTAAVIVLCGAAVAEWLLLALNLSRVSVVLLAAVVVSATWLGSRPAWFAAAFAIAMQNAFLLQPAMQDRLRDGEQILTVSVFFLVASLTGSIAGRARDEGRRSKALADLNTTLFEASRRMSASDEEAEIRRIALEEVQALTGEAQSNFGDAGAVELGWRAYRMRANDEYLGTLNWKTRQPSSGRPESVDETVCVLADLCAASIARARLASQKTTLEISERSERLQRALLSSISHDFRTPLSAILTSASSLREFGETFDKGTRMDLASTIQEEAERLNRFVVNLLNMTRLDAGALSVERGAFDLEEVVDRVVRSGQRTAESKSVTVMVTDGALLANGDPVLFESALRNVLENALRFADGSVTVACARDHGSLVIDVADDGPGVAQGEIEHIFDRFFRASTEQGTAKGAGLGLSITRGLMEAMHGGASASTPSSGRGLVVRLTLPAAVS